MKLLSMRAALALGSMLVATATTTEAATFQIGSFTSAAGNYTYSAGSLTGTTTGVYDFDPAAEAQVAAPNTVFNTATLQVVANATGNVTNEVGSLYSQAFSGSIFVKNGATLLLQVDFTNAKLFGRVNGAGETASLIGETSEGTVITYSSDVFNVAGLVDPKAFQFILTPVAPVIALNGNNFADFAGPDGANFSSNLAVPEPLTMSLLGVGLLGVGVVRRRRA